MNLKKILIIDDNKAIAELIKDVLVSSYKFEVSSCEDATDAEKKILAGLKPDVVLLDYHIKESTTDKFAVWLKSIMPSVKLVMISGEPQQMRKLQKMKNDGISDGCLSKPFGARNVAEVIHSLDRPSV